MSDLIETTVWGEGYRAYKRGNGAESNPYDPHVSGSLYQAWGGGWNEAAWEDSQFYDEIFEDWATEAIANCRAAA